MLDQSSTEVGAVIGGCLDVGHDQTKSVMLDDVKSGLAVSGGDDGIPNILQDRR